MVTTLPVLTARGRTIPEAWERSLLALRTQGKATRSDHAPKSVDVTLDCTMVMEIEDPLAEPRIHRCFPGGLNDLWTYVEEVVNGVHDAWIDPEAGKWSYTYHKRLFDYNGIDQLAGVIEELARAPHSRRAQAITWIPGDDLGAPDPPCLQRVWLRLIPADNGLQLVMNNHWRSRDAFKAAFMNLFALSELQKRLAGALAQRLDTPVTCGRMVDISDSYHLYLGYQEEWRAFWRSLDERSFADRTYTTDFAEPFFAEAREALRREAQGE